MKFMLWRRLYPPDHDLATLTQHDVPTLKGMALFGQESLPCQLNYSITCDAAWQTAAAEIIGLVDYESRCGASASRV